MFFFLKIKQQYSLLRYDFFFVIFIFVLTELVPYLNISKDQLGFLITIKLGSLQNKLPKNLAQGKETKKKQKNTSYQIA